jgi:hypothetical protein
LREVRLEVRKNKRFLRVNRPLRLGTKAEFELGLCCAGAEVGNVGNLWLVVDAT